MGVVVLPAAMVFAAGFLLFTVEPLVARMVLPMLGGSSLVWTTCVAFFQACVFVAAVLAHLTQRLGRARQALLLAVLSALSLLALPLSAPLLNATAEGSWLSLLVFLLSSLLLPCLMLGTTSLLLQQWLPARSASHLVAASNAGCLLGVLAYPLVVEPWTGMRTQELAWTAGCGALVVLLAGVCARVFMTSTPGRPPRQEPLPDPPRVWWFFLSFVPCALLLGVTAHMTQEVPSFPLLWLVPLALYLLSLVLPFASPSSPILGGLVRVAPFAQAMLAVMLFVPVRLSGFGVHLVAVFVASLVLHGRLAGLQPPPAQRASFGLWMTGGGAAAGMFSAVVAPWIFPTVLEFPLAIAAACLLFPTGHFRRRRPPSPVSVVLPPLLLSAVTLAVLGALPHAGDGRDVVARVAVLFAAAGLVVGFRSHPGRFSLGMAGLLSSAFWAFQLEGTLFTARSAYGVSRVVQEPLTGRHLLFHGTTIHGAQAVGKDAAPGFYYRPEGPLGRLFSSEPARAAGLRSVVVGLGAGSLAWYVQAGQEMRFFDIDPVVVRVARDPALFTFLSRAQGTVDVRLGDGRLLLAQQGDASLDVLVLDAFSSDSVPVHLLTLEAMQLYLRKLGPHGVLVFNTSNRHVEVERVVASAAQQLGLASAITLPPSDDVEGGTFAAVAATAEDLHRWTVGDARWVSPGPVTVRPWTDDRASLLPLLRW
jgi:hypothetical protein